MNIMITGGGTGGHTSPAVAIVEEFRKRDPQLTLQWIGCADSVEERVSRHESIPFRAVPVKGWPRGNLLKKFFSGLHLVRGLIRSLFLLRAFKPQLVIGVGGYVSFPVMKAAQWMRVPTVLHEQNKQMGMANRVLAEHAEKIFVSFENTMGLNRTDSVEWVGNPVRAGFYDPPRREDACAALGLDPLIPMVLVYGGSQGAQTINQAMTDLIRREEPLKVQWVWMTGKSFIGEARKLAEESGLNVHVHAFIDDMVQACAAATLIICRSGASSTAEIATIGRASILIPYPFATDNHQEENARAFETAGAAKLLLDDQCTADELDDQIVKLLDEPNQILGMEEAAKSIALPMAAEKLVDSLFEYLFGNRAAENEIRD
jgi:UDP-N-acetylglucosamine--N-acetylmuramyl-(pentapeptide) pyrophosphoryl-undecaprenol N-acetylglucosamine transferase